MTIYRVTVGGKEYEVKIEDVNAQPVRTVVNGQPVQVWVQEQKRAKPAPSPAQVAPKAAPAVLAAASPIPAAVQPSAAPEREVRAPMPGTIVSIAAQPGDQVEVGQDLCILDAMKMNNRVRAPGAGTIAQVHVSAGQQVQHGDLLVTFLDEG